MEEVVGSIPTRSTIFSSAYRYYASIHVRIDVLRPTSLENYSAFELSQELLRPILTAAILFIKNSPRIALVH